MIFSANVRGLSQKSQCQSKSNCSKDSKKIPLLQLHSKQYTSYKFSKNPCRFNSSRISYANFMLIFSLDLKCPG